MKVNKKNYLLLFLSFVIKVSIGQTDYSKILEQLPILKIDDLSFMDDSHDPQGRNRDGYSSGNFLYEQANAVAGDTTREYVLTEIKGPGIIDRIWMTWIDSAAHLRFYFDGELLPSIDLPYYTFFRQEIAPYNAPISEDFNSASGGYFSYLPIPFQTAVKVTITLDSTLYYQFGYRKFMPDSSNQTFDLNTDLTQLNNLMSPNGRNPKDTSSYNYATQEFDLLSSESKLVYDNEGPKSIEEIRLSVPALDFSNDELFITDDGRAYKGSSKFTVKINGSADSILLIRRYDYQSGNQKGVVFVDNLLLGSWTSLGYNNIKKFDIATIKIPKIYFNGKSKITIRIVDEAGGNPFNEFYYWVKSNETTTDSLDIGNVLDEQAHNYVITDERWNRVSIKKQITPEKIRIKNEAILKNTFVKIVWDDEAIPSVNCPIGYFFGLGTLDAVNIKSVPVGINDLHEMYAFWSMPFEKNCKIYIENKGIESVNNLKFIVATKNSNYDFEQTGKFKIEWKNTPTVDSFDYNYANINGWGKFLGIVLEARNPESFFWLEGDERFFIDNNKTPAIHGTGTEDYFNGGFYFYNGTYNKPFSGLSSQFGEHRSMYRFQITDPLNFLMNGSFNQEHGEFNNWNVDYNSVAFFYVRDSTKMVLSDSFNIANTDEKVAHNYTGNGLFEYPINGSFEGDDDNIKYDFTVSQVNDSSNFMVQIANDNLGVRLQRVFDYTVLNQSAEVWVDGLKVGIWYAGGQNKFISLREEFFMIPAIFTKNKSTINITIKSIGENPWTEIKYNIYSIKGKKAISGINQQEKNIKLSVFPNPSSDFIQFLGIKENSKIETAFILDVSGKVVKILHDEDLYSNKISVKSLPVGLYLLQINSENKSYSAPFVRAN